MRAKTIIKSTAKNDSETIQELLEVIANAVQIAILDNYPNCITPFQVATSVCGKEYSLSCPMEFGGAEVIRVNKLANSWEISTEGRKPLSITWARSRIVA